MPWVYCADRSGVRRHWVQGIPLGEVLASVYSGGTFFFRCYPGLFWRHEMLRALPGVTGHEAVIVTVRGKRPLTILRGFDKSNKGLFTPVSIGSEDEITGGSLVRFSLKALWFSVVLEAVVLGVVQVVSVATKSIDLGGSTTER